MTVAVATPRRGDEDPVHDGGGADAHAVATPRRGDEDQLTPTEQRLYDTLLPLAGAMRTSGCSRSSRRAAVATPRRGDEDDGERV